MTCTELIGIRAGDVVSIVGCNGKTSLLYRLAQESRAGKVLLSTTTHIRLPQPGCYDQLAARGAELGKGINLYYDGANEQKIWCADIDRLCALCPADGITLLECDGSRGLPFKGWAEQEPVIVPRTTITVGVCATWRVGELFSEKTVHRPALFQALTGARPGESVTMAHLAAMVSAPGGMFRNARGKKVLLINGMGGGEEDALSLVKLLPTRFRCDLAAIVAVDLKRGTGSRLAARC